MKDEAGSKDFIVRLQESVNGSFKLGLAKDNMDWESVATRPVNVAAGNPDYNVSSSVKKKLKTLEREQAKT
jgi:hypothetical protein